MILLGPWFKNLGPSKENMLIKFPSYKSTGVNFKEEKSAQGHKCFKMSGGKVEVIRFAYFYIT